MRWSGPRGSTSSRSVSVNVFCPASTTPSRCSTTPRAKTGRAESSVLFVMRLIELHREPTRSLEPGDQAVAVVLDVADELYAARRELRDRVHDVVAVERDVGRARAGRS